MVRVQSQSGFGDSHDSTAPLFGQVLVNKTAESSPAVAAIMGQIGVSDSLRGRRGRQASHAYS